MEIKRNGSQPSGKGPADWFTGAVRIDPLFQPLIADPSGRFPNACQKSAAADGALPPRAPPAFSFARSRCWC